MQQKHITEDEFVKVYRPIRNHFEAYAPFDWGQGYGTMFETYGNELDFVRSQPSLHIWTFVSDDEGDCILSGYHRVNRIGYFITAKPIEAGNIVNVAIDNR